MENTRLRYSSDPKWSNEAVPLVLPQNRVPSPCSRLVIDSNCSTVWCNHRQPPITAKSLCMGPYTERPPVCRWTGLTDTFLQNKRINYNLKNQIQPRKIQIWQSDLKFTCRNTRLVATHRWHHGARRPDCAPPLQQINIGYSKATSSAEIRLHAAYILCWLLVVNKA